MTSNKRFGIFAACAVAAVVAIALVNLYEARHSLPPPKEISYSQFLDDLEQDRIRTVTLTGQEIAGYFKDRTRFITYAANDPDLVKALRQKNVDIIAEPVPQGTSTFVGLLKSLLPLILLIVLFIYFMNRMSRPGGRAMSLGIS
jgi:cell division protease FtsH